MLTLKEYICILLFIGSFCLFLGALEIVDSIFCPKITFVPPFNSPQRGTFANKINVSKSLNSVFGFLDSIRGYSCSEICVS